MLTVTQPLLTRRLKVSFEIEAKAVLLPDRLAKEKPELLVLQQALIEHPDLLGKALVCQALRKSAINLDETKTFLLEAAGGKPLHSLRPLLYEKMIPWNVPGYLKELIEHGFSAQFISQAQITDLESGEGVDLQSDPAPSFYLDPDWGRFLLAEVQGEKVLCINLVEYDLEDILGDALEVSKGDVDRILACVSAGELYPQYRNDLAMQLAKVMEWAQVEVYANPQANEF